MRSIVIGDSDITSCEECGKAIYTSEATECPECLTIRCKDCDRVCPCSITPWSDERNQDEER
jgi:hypothetical protein